MTGLCAVSDKTIKHHISNLKDEGRVERKSSLKSGHWEIKGEEQ